MWLQSCRFPALPAFIFEKRKQTIFKGRVYFASISDIQLDVSPSENFWMQNRTKALELYYFPSSWMSPLDVQNGCALEHWLRVNSISHPMKTSHPTKKYRYIGLRRMSPIWGTVHFCNDPCKKPSVKMTFPDPYLEQHWHECPKHLQSPHLDPHGLH